VDLEFIPMQFGERFEKARIWAASNDLPDVLWVDYNENIYTEWCQWADSGLFRPMPDDLSRWPLIKQTFDSYITDDIATRNGKVYAIGAQRDMSAYDYMVCLGWGYRADWAEAVGMRQENDIYTWQQWWDMVRAVLEQDPGGNGPGRTYGSGGPQFYFPDCYGIWQTTNYEWGFEEPFFMMAGDDYHWYPTLPEYYVGLKEAKKLYDEGLIWKDLVTDTNSTLYMDLYYAGQMVTLAQHTTVGNIFDIRRRMIEAFPDGDRSLMYMPARVSSPVDDTFFWQKQSPDHWGANSFRADITDEKMNRYLDMWEWLLTDDGENFRLYGLEDKDFKKNSDGTLEVLWPKNEAGLYVDPYPSGSRTFYSRPGSSSPMQVAFRTLTIPEEDRIDGRRIWDFDWENGHIGYVDFVALFCSTPKKDEFGMFVAETKAKAIELLATSTVDTIESEWKVWTDSMMPKVQQVLDELNALEYKPKDHVELAEYLKNNPIPNYNR
jgi:ABC-type glycerol-3-phosphate transport system substrate-binding protein